MLCLVCLGVWAPPSLAAAGAVVDDSNHLASLQLAIADLTATFGSRYPDGASFGKRLDELKRQEPAVQLARARGDAAGLATASEFDNALARLRSEALLANPLLDCDRIMVLRRQFPDPKAARQAMGAQLGVGSLNAHTSDDIARQDCWNDELSVISNLRGQPGCTTLYNPGGKQTIIDPVLHFDGSRVLFAKQGTKEKNWRLFEIGADGQGLHQVTPDDGGDVAHFDPCYLPDGRIIFASTAVYQGLPCEFGAQAMVCLYQMDPVTQKIRQLTFEQDSDWCPTMLPDGGVLYQRWEYTDQSHSNSRMLFRMNPDGTAQREVRGSGSWFPGSFFYAKAIPGESNQLIGVAGGHHGTPRSGRLLILDPSQGRRDGQGIVQEIPGWGKKVEPIVRDRLVDGVWPQFLMPCPLSSKYHLVAAKLGPDSLWGIYLVDVFDNITLVKEAEGEALLWPVAMRKVPVPPVIPDRVNLSTNEATVLISDIYSGPGLKGTLRGTVKNLRVIEYYFSRRGFGGLYGTLGMDGPWDVKRILGTVPVDADGSAHFSIPANTPLSLQPLDDHGQALQLMRSWFVGMPGEVVSCTGCHEAQNDSAVNKPLLAALRKPSPIKPWYGPARGFSFVREVQPVLDKYCVSCHDGTKPDRPCLRGGDMLTDWSSQLAGRWDGGGKFTKSYYELQRFVRRPGIEGDRRMFTPLDFHFSSMELGQMLRKGHHGVTLDGEAHERLAAWADLNAPFYGTWGEIPQFCKDPAGAQRLAAVNRRAAELQHKYVPSGPHPDYEVIPETPKYDITPVKPASDSITPTVAPTCPGWPLRETDAVRIQKASAPRGEPEQTVNLTNKDADISLRLVWIPPGEFVMGSSDGHRDESPASRVVIPKGYWLGRCEVSNLEFKRFMPEHESREADRHGYQFGIVGYDQDQPDQPAVRVSWEEAMGYCRWLAVKTGRKVTLPTEAQWEWACRAGSATPFWFGDLTSNFSPFANLGDRKLKEFAADTALDNYSAARPMVNPNKYDDWIPRDDRFDDGRLVTATVGKYQANRWGLMDMHGNACEWTRSAYRPYPYNDADGRNDQSPAGVERVARGGSWYDRPQLCTASRRFAYSEHQKVFNVGFRVLIEE